MRQILLVVNVLICGLLSAADTCPNLPGYNIHGTSCFKLYTTKKTWADAEASCLADGGHLASIHSSEEQAFVADLASASSSNIWIGITGVPPNMAWSDDTKMDYEAWMGNNPDYSGQSCSMMKSAASFIWADQPCTKTYPYICKTAKVVAQTQANFMLIPDGVPMDGAVEPSSSQMVGSALDCGRKCKRDTQCVHFTLAEHGGKYVCETYTSLYRPPTAAPPTDNYKKIV